MVRLLRFFSVFLVSSKSSSRAFDFSVSSFFSSSISLCRVVLCLTSAAFSFWVVSAKSLVAWSGKFLLVPCRGDVINKMTVHGVFMAWVRR